MTNESSLINRKRLKDCNHGDTIKYLGFIYQVRKQSDIKLLIHHVKGFYYSTEGTMVFGLKCQMWVEIKTTTD